MVRKAERTCDLCGKVLKTPWGVQVHKGRVHTGNKSRCTRKRNKLATNGAMQSSVVIKHCPMCGFTLDKLRIVDDARL